MNKLSSIAALVSAALIGIAAESAWSDEATPQDSAAQHPAPMTGYVPGWHPSPSSRGGYAQPWQQPLKWPAPPPVYGQLPPYYPPYGQYRAVPGAPAENPLRAELTQTREQLTEKKTELDTANTQLAALQAELQAATQVLQLAQSGNTLTSQQLDTAMAQADSLGNELAKVKSGLESQQTTLQSTGQPRAAEHDSAHSALASRDEQAAISQADVQDMKRSLAVAIAERDGLLADITAVIAERDGLQKELAACRSELTRPRDTSATPQPE